MLECVRAMWVRVGAVRRLSSQLKWRRVFVMILHFVVVSGIGVA